jgi:anti-sigma B factor antagonist
MRFRRGAKGSTMSVRIGKRTEGDVTIISCEGNIALGATANEFRGMLREVLMGGAKKVVLDLGEVKYVDSTGIGEMVGGFNLAMELDSSIKLARVPQKVQTVLDVTRLSTVFESLPSVEEAVTRF